MEHWYLHADLDAFFASVEQLDHPEYRGKPLIVGGLPSDLRSVVSTASYEARKYGVHSAMPTKEAVRLCPDGIFIRGNHRRYKEMSWTIMQIFKRYSPDVQQMSIDEAFIDLTGTEKLFGPPEETAMKIKKAVKEETGLTVSIGLACTKYFAKLSSEINKPDGFYFMKPGTETDYMLSVPIEKIWGIGKKTAARIKDSGLKTTRQIYETDFSTLIFLYGENTATFLYNVLRGKCDEMFGTEAKSHSLSNERTFPFDITDPYTSETVLLELAHTVMFRMIRENLHSKTITLKIRYDDFSTISARQTFENEVITLDSYFEKVRELFNRKYDRTRGVRLLGIGFDNVHEEEITYQQELFDDGQKKKQAVEKAILNIEKKFPDIQVQKARVLKPGTKTVITFLFLGLLKTLFAPAVIAESKENLIESADILALPGESPSTLFDLKKDSKELEIISDGYWKSEITDSLNMSFGKNYPFNFSLDVPVFKQEIDLTFNLLYNKKWFFETAFAEEFRRNTITFGYQNGKILKKAVISNRNITYPSDYSSSIFGYNLSGGTNQAPGIMANLSGEKWNADFLFRYDMVKRQETVYSGLNQITENEITAGSFISGRFFTLPEGWISKIRNIYIENKEGDLKDSQGRKFTRLPDSDFFILQSKNLLILKEKAVSQGNISHPVILAEFSDKDPEPAFMQDAGSWDNRTSFLGAIQEKFSEAKNIKLSDFYPSLFTSFDNSENKELLVLQTRKTFTPFGVYSVYDAGLIQKADYYIQSRTSNEILEEFRIETLDSSFYFMGNDYFADNHTILSVKDNSSVNQFPFASYSPDLYLYPEKDSDLAINVKRYTPVIQFQIPSGTPAGSISITKNGISVFNFFYDTSTGIITLQDSVSDTDRIVISWSEDGSDFFQGAITSAAGFKYNFNPDFKIDFDVTSSLPAGTLYSVQNETFDENLAKGFSSFNSGISYSKKNLKLRNNTSLSFFNTNTTGKKLVYAAEEISSQTFYNSSSSGHKTKTVPYISDNSLYEAVFCSPGNLYGITDKQISGFAIPVEINFSPAGENSKAYTACDIDLKETPLGHSFNFAVKTIMEKLPSDFSSLNVFLQLGSDSDTDYSYTGASELPEWNITGQIDFSSNQWQEISVQLSEKDRAFLTENHDARIIIIKDESLSPEEFKGIFFFGPYEIKNDSMDYSASDGMKVVTETKEDPFAPSASEKTSAKTRNYISNLKWTNRDLSESPEKLTFHSYFPQADYSIYENIHFDFKINSLAFSDNSEKCNAFVFTLCQNKQISLELSLSKEVFTSLSKNQWHDLSINPADKSICIDNTKLSETQFTLYLNEQITNPSEMKLEFNNVSAGDIDIDSIYFEGTKTQFLAQNHSELSWKSEKTILQVKDFELLKDLSFSSSADASYSPSNKESDFLFKNNTETGFTLANIRLQADASLANEKSLIKTAGHSVFSKAPLLGIFSFSDTYRFSPYLSEKNISDSFGMNLTKIKIPVNLTLKGNQTSSGINQNENYEGSLKFNSKYFIAELSGNADEKTSSTENPSSIENNFSEYFSSWSNLAENYFSGGNENAYYRKQIYSGSAKINLPKLSTSPEIKHKLSGQYNSVSKTDFANNSVFTLSVPFQIKKQKFSASWQKEAYSLLPHTEGGNFKSDAENIFDSQKEFSDFYSVFLFQDLFKDSFNSNFNSDYSITWNRTLSNSIKDFYLPSNLTVKAGRQYIASETEKDFYQFKLSQSFQSVNLFGNDSRLKYFSWYSQDEFLSSFEFTLKTPEQDFSNSTVLLSSYGQALFYIGPVSNLKASMDLIFSENRNWSTRESLIYMHKGIKSPLADCVRFFFDSEKSPETKITRKETLNIEIGAESGLFYQQYKAGHSCDISFLDYYSVYADTNLYFSHKQNKAGNLSLEITLGAKINY